LTYYTDSDLTTEFTSTSLSLFPAEFYNSTTSVTVPTTTSVRESIYIKASLYGLTASVTQQVSINVCDGETISALSSRKLYYIVGTAASLNLQETFSGYFSSAPTNTAIPTCNQITVNAFSDSGRTMPWAGSPAFTGSTAGTFNLNTTVSVDTTSTLGSEVIYLSAVGPAQGATAVTTSVRVNICDTSTVSLTGLG